MATALYASLCGPILIYLSIQVIKARRAEKVAVGGGTPAVDRVRSVQSNFVEYAPLTIVLMGLAELQDVPSVLIHCAGIALVLSRLAHAYGVSQANENFRFRVTAMMVTFTNLAYCSALALFGFVSAQFV